MSEPTGFEVLKAYFDRQACQRATAPLRPGVEIAVCVEGGNAFTLLRTKNGMETLPEAPTKPDMTFSLPLVSLQSLAADTTEDIGEIGVALLQLVAHSDPQRRMDAKVHIGPLDLFLHGYLGVLPLGGPTMMKFLANKGFSSISKIKEAITRFRG